MVLAPCWATPRRLRRGIAGPLSPTCALCSSAAMPGLPIYPLTCARRYCIRLPGRTMRARRKRREERKNERAGLQSAGKRRSSPAARAHRWSDRRGDLRHRRGEVSGTILSLLSSPLHVCSGAVTWLAALADAAAPHRRRFKVVAGPGIILYVFVMTFAAIDWVMSLSPHWASTIYGFLFIVGQLISAMSLMIAVVVLLGRTGPFAGVPQSRHTHDLGKLLLAFV